MLGLTLTLQMARKALAGLALSSVPTCLTDLDHPISIFSRTPNKRIFTLTIGTLNLSRLLLHLDLCGFVGRIWGGSG